MEFINYINTLHNLNASGTNTLAEAQINSVYFDDIYYPFPIVKSLKNIVTKDKNSIVILTGHAGDGKSTIAFDLLREIDEKYKHHQFKEHEVVDKYQLNVLKDMSELSLEQRKNWLEKAFSTQGSWVIVSNTGPLLTSIATALKDTSWGSDLKDIEIESKILECLNKEINSTDSLEALKLPLCVDGKDLYIVNVAKLNNIEIALNIFQKIINHPEWHEIVTNYPQHAITQNYLTIKQHYDEVEDSIRLTYLYLINYEKRMTLRQMLAHLSVSITGGFNLLDNPKETLLFSDTFFCYLNNQIWHKAKDTKIMELVSHINAGGYTSLEVENFITNTDNFDSVHEPLKSMTLKYIDSDTTSESTKIKASLRRILFMYGIKNDTNQKGLFLNSVSIHNFNKWQQDYKSFENDSRRLKKSCIKALNLFYSGSEDKDNLNITLKRSDATVFQIAQLMICSVPVGDIRINYDQQRQLPYLFLKNHKTVRLDLSLPLLDYIDSLVMGDITESLNPIYKTQLERFKLKLIESKENDNNQDIVMVRVQPNGDLKSSEIYFDQDKNDNTILKVEG